jgi:hypothetical protein
MTSRVAVESLIFEAKVTEALIGAQVMVAA